jgi:RHS repeat-associated protein
LQQQNLTYTLNYGLGEQRIHTKMENNNNLVYETFYLNSSNMEIRSSQAFSNTYTKELTYLYAGGTPFAIHEKEGENEKLYYLHLDYQGSIKAITNEQGNIVEQRDYDAWGRPRNPNTLNYTAANPFTHSLNTAIITSRGYTFHEHIFEFSLINMNARMYDPVTRRVISPDNYIQAPDNTQSFNRYSYCFNNPLKYTDPDGNIIFTAAVLIAAPFTGGASLALLPYAIGADVGMWQGGSMANGTMNPTKWDYSSGKTWGFMAGGAVVGGVSAFAGIGTSTALAKYTTLGVNHVMNSAISGAVSGAIGGFGTGGLSGVAETGRWSWSNAWKGAGWGAAGGFVLGGAAKATENLIMGRNWWNGKVPVLPSPPPAMGSGGATSDGLEFDFPSGNKYDAQGNQIFSLKDSYNGKEVVNNLGIETTVEIPESFIPELTRNGDGVIYHNPSLPIKNPSKVIGSVRIMTSDGRVIFYNGLGQPINPINMQTLPKIHHHFYLK